MNAVLIGSGLLLAVFIVVVVPTMAPQVHAYGIEQLNFTPADGAKSVLLCTLLTGTAGLIFYRHRDHGTFLFRIFVAGLLIRVLVGSLIFAFHGREFFGVDALGYDFYGAAQLEAWRGDQYYGGMMTAYFDGGLANAWGMINMVAALYAALGRNPLAVQMVTAVLGAATAPLIYLCALHVFRNTRVARFSAFAVAFFPSLVLWSSQGLKDGPIVFFLVLAIHTTMKLGEKFSWKNVAILTVALFLVLAFRFYIF